MQKLWYKMRVEYHVQNNWLQEVSMVIVDLVYLKKKKISP